MTCLCVARVHMLEEHVREVEIRAQQTIDDERRKRREFMVRGVMTSLFVSNLPTICLYRNLA